MNQNNDKQITIRTDSGPSSAQTDNIKVTIDVNDPSSFNPQGETPILLFEWDTCDIIEFYSTTYVMRYWHQRLRKFVPYMDLEGGKNMHGWHLTIPDPDDANLYSTEPELYECELDDIIREHPDLSLEEYTAILEKTVRRIKVEDDFDEHQETMRQIQRKQITGICEYTDPVRSWNLKYAVLIVKNYIRKRDTWDDVERAEWIASHQDGYNQSRQRPPGFDRDLDPYGDFFMDDTNFLFNYNNNNNNDDSVVGSSSGVRSGVLAIEEGKVQEQEQEKEQEQEQEKLLEPKQEEVEQQTQKQKGKEMQVWRLKAERKFCLKSKRSERQDRIWSISICTVYIESAQYT